MVPPDKDICFMDYQRNITLAGESYTEACQSKTSLLKPKKTLVFGNWNILTMYAVRKSAQVAKEMREYNIDILGIRECRWTGFGKMQLTSGENHNILGKGRQFPTQWSCHNDVQTS